MLYQSPRTVTGNTAGGTHRSSLEGGTRKPLQPRKIRSRKKCVDGASTSFFLCITVDNDGKEAAQSLAVQENPRLHGCSGCADIRARLLGHKVEVGWDHGGGHAQTLPRLVAASVAMSPDTCPGTELSLQPPHCLI